MAERTTDLMAEKLRVQLAVSQPPNEEQRSEEQRRHLTRIKRAIRRKTGGGISELKLELQDDSLLLRGRCSSFYHKQVAQEACMSLLGGQTLVNEIHVEAKPR